MYQLFSNQPSPNDVLATGVGMVTPLAIGREESWRRLVAGETAGRSLTEADISHFDELAALLKSPPAGATIDHKEVSRVVSRQVQVAMPQLDSEFRRCFQHDCLNNLITFSALEALEDAKLDPATFSSKRIGCVIGASKASLRAMELEAAHFRDVRPTANSKDLDTNRWMNAFMPDAPLRCVRFLTQAEGPGSCPVAACATGLISIIEAAQYIRSGQCDICVAGSADASVRPSVIASFHRLGVLSKHQNAASACRPFDLHRDGFVIGEGSGVVVLESRRHAEQRGAVSYGQILHGCWLTDPTGMTQIDSSGQIVSILVNQLLDGVEVPDLVNLHGTGTESNDLAESGGLEHWPAPTRPICSATKGATGHLLGAAGSVEFAYTLLSLRDQVVPVTANHQQPDPACSVPIFATTSQSKPVNSALKLSLGFGGHIAGCVVRR